MRLLDGAFCLAVVLRLLDGADLPSLQTSNLSSSSLDRLSDVLPQTFSAKASELSDHSITDDSMHVIWARGQKAEMYYHIPRSGIDDSSLTPSDPDYYKRDELKYHGRNPDNQHRGAFNLNFHGKRN